MTFEVKKRIRLITAETGSADAVVFVDQIDARRSVEAFVSETIVDVVLTMTSVKAFEAVTAVVARRVLATERVAAQLGYQTFVDICIRIFKMITNREIKFPTLQTDY